MVKKFQHIFTLFIIVCFFLNNAVISGTAFGLSVPLMCDDLVGIQHEDMGRIKFSLEAQLKGLFESTKAGTPIDFNTFKTILKKRTDRENTIYQPAEIQPFFHEANRVKEGVRVMYRIKDKYGERTYYAVFGLSVDEKGGFPIKGIYTEEEYEKFNNLSASLPQRQPKDEKAIDRYIQYEKGMDSVLRYAHEHGCLIKHSFSHLDIKSFIHSVLVMLNINIENPGNLIPIEDREVYYVKQTPEITKMLEENPLVITDENGNEHKIIPRSLSRNNAVYLFAPEKEYVYFDYFISNELYWDAEELKPWFHCYDYDRTDRATAVYIHGWYDYDKDAHYPQMPLFLGEIPDLIVHEIGVMCGLPVISVDKYGQAHNEIDLRWGEYRSMGDKFDAPAVTYSLVSFDTTLLALLARGYMATESIADQAGREIPTHPDTKYTLLMPSEFFANGELENHRLIYGDRFNLDSISAKTFQQFVDKVLAKSNGIENRTIALVSHWLPKDELKRLTDAGIRFIITDTDMLSLAKTDKLEDRKRFQQNTYVIMLLVRYIGKRTPKKSSTYKLLSFYLNTHFQLSDSISARDYIYAIVTNNIIMLVKGVLFCKPVIIYDMPEHDKVAATLIAA